MQLSLGEVAKILGSDSAAPDRIARGYSIDSRTVKPGQLFFALRGPRFDGHEFVEAAFERGAMGAVVERAFRDHAARALPRRASALIAVNDPSEALQQLARGVRRAWGRRLVAITGSAGKTTTKELAAAILGQRFSVLKSPGNLNNQFGLPLALLALEPAHDLAVVELAMSAPGEIARLARIAEPQVGLVTNVAPAHLQFFDSLDSIARAKRELIDNLSNPATAVLNSDDPRVRRFSEGFQGRVLTYGFEAGAAFRVAEFRPRQNGGSWFRVKGPEFNSEFQLGLPGRHNAQNALAAIAVAFLFEIPSEAIQKALETFQTLHHRSEILTLPGGMTVINDSYNSNPLGMERMLETLAAWPGARRRIVVAGEMLELGESSPTWHRKIGQKCAENGVDWLWAVQGDARFFLEGAAEAGMPGERMRFFPTAREAAERCATLLEPGDVLLVKGSRGVHLEKVVELLTGEGRQKLAVDSQQ